MQCAVGGSSQLSRSQASAASRRQVPHLGTHEMRHTLGAMAPKALVVTAATFLGRPDEGSPAEVAVRLSYSCSWPSSTHRVAPSVMG